MGKYMGLEITEEEVNELCRLNPEIGSELKRRLSDSEQDDRLREQHYPDSFYNFRINFNPFQYKPYFRLMNNGKKHVYIADEVGVGKTYEAGIILSELLYRREMSVGDNIVILCPNSLCQKWQNVLAESFGLGSTRRSGFTENMHGISIVPITARALEKKKIGEYVGNENNAIKCFVLDEAHNANGAYADSIIQLSRISEFRVIISATPVSRNDLLNEDEEDGEENLIGIDREQNTAEDGEPEINEEEQKNYTEVQKKILYGVLYGSEKDDGTFTMANDNDEFNRTLKKHIRDGSVNWHVVNKNIANPILKEFIDGIIPDFFDEANKVCRYGYLKMLGSSPEAAKGALDKLSGLLESEEDAKIMYILSRSPEEREDLVPEKNVQEIRDNESGIVDDVEDEEMRKTISEARKTVRTMISELSDMTNNASGEGHEKRKDEKLELLKEIIKGRQEIADILDRIRRIREENPEMTKENASNHPCWNEHKEVWQKALPEKLTESEIVEDFWDWETNENFYRKIIVFTNYNDTVKYLADKLENSIWVNGKIDTGERLRRFLEFKTSRDKNVLIVTNVACEGQDMDFCNAVVNYDMHDNPVLLEQRKGRIDRDVPRKKELFIYNFLTQGVDPDEETIYRYRDPENEGYKEKLEDYSNSIWRVILRKLKEIEFTTGLYYNIVDSIGSEKEIEKRRERERNGEEDPDKKEREEARDKVCKLFGENVPDFQAESFEELKEAYRKFWNEEGFALLQQVFEKRQNTSDGKLIELIKPEQEKEEQDDYFTVRIHKKEMELLGNIMYGANLSSHLIYKDN